MSGAIDESDGRVSTAGQMDQTEEVARFLASAEAIIAAAKSRSILLRLLGSLAYRVHCPQNVPLLDAMHRELTDIDFASERRFANDIESLLSGLGYVPDDDVALATGGSRHCYRHRDTGMVVDIFMDRLHFCHAIPFKGRLDKDDRTLPLAELLLEKMQIVELNEKDVKDTIVLLLEHELGDTDEETVNASYISKLLASDWGFFYTVKTNLDKVVGALEMHDALDRSQRDRVGDRIERLIERIDGEPKSAKWKLRAKVGTRMLWYQPVEAKKA